jgi:hypothetical protein
MTSPQSKSLVLGVSPAAEQVEGLLADADARDGKRRV